MINIAIVRPMEHPRYRIRRARSTIDDGLKRKAWFSMESTEQQQDT
ncbi:hypothetical protein EVJ58_g1172 [Rhodofomes roseus]|uniref:Uncharacterized protein n=1 Tax=Rhodofomes roseus TaxID=34475 RepID=A0A4Y9Z2B0_9APHY|nr:hypothetical protein EVJ58_g1172 [Rhodofomes roseus]